MKTFMDRWKVMPRLLVAAFIILTLASGYWFMTLENATANDVQFIAIIWGAGAATILGVLKLIMGGNDK